MAPSLTSHLPPDLLLLVRLSPVLALTFQPASVLPSKTGTKPSSFGFSSACVVGIDARARKAPAARAGIRRQRMGRLRGTGGIGTGSITGRGDSCKHDATPPVGELIHPCPKPVRRSRCSFGHLSGSAACRRRKCTEPR